MRILATMVIAAAVGLIGCSGGSWSGGDGGDWSGGSGSGSGGGGSGSVSGPTITGTITTSDGRKLPEDGEIVLRLLDVSRADAKAQVVSERTVPVRGRNTPVPFELGYSRDDIKERRSYAVEIRVRKDGKVRYRSTTRNAVLTQGHPRYNIDVVVDPM